MFRVKSAPVRVLAGNIRKERHETGAFDSLVYFSLMARGNIGLTGTRHPCMSVQKAFQILNILVVNVKRKGWHVLDFISA